MWPTEYGNVHSPDGSRSWLGWMGSHKLLTFILCYTVLLASVGLSGSQLVQHYYHLMLKRAGLWSISCYQRRYIFIRLTKLAFIWLSHSFSLYLQFICYISNKSTCQSVVHVTIICPQRLLHLRKGQCLKASCALFTGFPMINKYSVLKSDSIMWFTALENVSYLNVAAVPSLQS
jgi:hypothetical protein